MLIIELFYSQKEVFDGLWLRESNRGYELKDKVIGIIGYGNTGKSLAKKLSGMEVEVLFNDLRRNLSNKFARQVSLETIQNKLYENQMNRNKLLKNQTIEVLVENLTDDKTQTFGRSEYMTPVIFNGNKEHIGKTVPVKIKKFNRTTLFGDIVEDLDKKVA